MASISPFWLTIIFSCFACMFTTIGGAVVLLFNQISKKVIGFVLSFSAGIMIASSIFSLLLVGIDCGEQNGQNPAIVCTFGVFFGIFFVIFMEFFINRVVAKNGVLSGFFDGKFREPILSTIAISLHNIPEGLCIGVSFAGAAMSNSSSATLASIMLAVGIGIQNFPEGSSVSLPLYNVGFSKQKSFLWAFLSGVVEPVFAVVGFFCTGVISSILPFLLCFAAGAMIVVSCIDLLPESLQISKTMATLGLCFGFCIMMFLDLIF